MDELYEIICKLQTLSVNNNEGRKIQHLLDDSIRNLQLIYFEIKRHTDVKEWILDEIRNIFEQHKNFYLLENDTDMTSLAEECCNVFKVDFEDGPLDRDDHWIWKDIYDYLEWFIQQNKNDSEFNTNNI
jgi:hypothetical protein